MIRKKITGGITVSHTEHKAFYIEVEAMDRIIQKQDQIITDLKHKLSKYKEYQNQIHKNLDKDGIGVVVVDNKGDKLFEGTYYEHEIYLLKHKLAKTMAVLHEIKMLTLEYAGNGLETMQDIYKEADELEKYLKGE
jgi:translation elongation factor EF-G